MWEIKEFLLIALDFNSIRPKTWVTLHTEETNGSFTPALDVAYLGEAAPQHSSFTSPEPNLTPGSKKLKPMFVSASWGANKKIVIISLTVGRLKWFFTRFMLGRSRNLQISIHPMERRQQENEKQRCLWEKRMNGALRLIKLMRQSQMLEREGFY